MVTIKSRYHMLIYLLSVSCIFLCFFHDLAGEAMESFSITNKTGCSAINVSAYCLEDKIYLLINLQNILMYIFFSE